VVGVYSIDLPIGLKNISIVRAEYCPFRLLLKNQLKYLIFSFDHNLTVAIVCPKKTIISGQKRTVIASMMISTSKIMGILTQPRPMTILLRLGWARGIESKSESTMIFLWGFSVGAGFLGVGTRLVPQ
jgi:hypothetical protein